MNSMTNWRRREVRKQEILNKVGGSDSEDLLEGIV